MCSFLDVESHRRTTPSSSLALSGHMHLTTASATAAMRLKSRTCQVASQYRKRCRGFVPQRLLLQRPLIAWMSSAFLVCLRRSRLSSVKALTSWPFGRKLKGGRATRKRCCKGIQHIHVHVLVDKKKRNAQRLDCRRKFFHGSLVFPGERHTHSRVVLHARTADVRALGTPSSRVQLCKVTSSSPHRRSPLQPLHGANSCRRRGRCAK